MAKNRNAAYLAYDLAWYLAGLVVLPVALLWALFSPRGRRSFLPRLGWVNVGKERQGGLLLHGVSVGEVTALKPLVTALRQRHPDLPLLISSTTPSGQETARRLFPDLTVVFFPLDLPFATKTFLRRARPIAVVLAELEIWPNFLRATNRLDIPVGIVNGRITTESLAGYRRVQRLLPQFDRIALYGVQNQVYADRFAALGVPHQRIRITGNLKFENLPDPHCGPKPEWVCWLGGKSVLTLASTHADEEIQFCKAIINDSAFDQTVVVVVPRHPRRAPSLLTQLKAVVGSRPLLLRSQLQPDSALADGSILIVDSFGELEDIYRCSAAVFVGGSLVPHGGQNVLEPAALAKPVVIGPHFRNFPDEVALLSAAGGLRSSSDLTTLLGYLRDWLLNPHAAEEAGNAGRASLKEGQGASDCTIRFLEEAKILPSPIPSPK
ncbi:MAG: hypothetical protein COB96_06060 [Planctomycetota bacterium]|nr:MAG: hypothetical protein COB96_06060 [Planctomycetota bacterium]